MKADINRGIGMLSVLGLIGSLSGLAVAQQGTPAASESRAGAWLAIQSGNQQASSTPQVATDLERDKAVERFLKTYDNPIPESYYGTKFEQE